MRGLTFIFPLLIGLLFLLGRGFVFGLDGNEPDTIMFPQNTVVGWLFVGLSIIWVFPPWLTARIVKFIKRLIKGNRLRTEALKKRVSEGEQK